MYTKILDSKSQFIIMFEYCEHKVSKISKKNQAQKCLYSAPFTFRFHNPPIETVAVKTNQKTSVERIFEKPISTCRTLVESVGKDSCQILSVCVDVHYLGK